VLKAENGVVFIKLAIALPIVLGSIFFFILLSKYTLARTTLAASIQKGAALGRTYGNSSFANRDESVNSLATKIDQFLINEAPLPEILFNDPPSEVFATYDGLMSATRTGRGRFSPPSDVWHFPISGGLTGISSSYILAMAATYQNLVSAYGGAEIRYPCSFSNIQNIPGCLACYPYLYQTPTIGLGVIPRSQSGLCLPDYDVFIECTWNATPPSLSFINNLIPGITLFPPIVVRSSGNAVCTPQLFSNSPKRTTCTWCAY